MDKHLHERLIVQQPLPVGANRNWPDFSNNVLLSLSCLKFELTTAF